jgi:hypothetical protein
MMKRAEYDQILRRLEEIAEQDRRVVNPDSDQAVTISVEDLFSYGKRYEERLALLNRLLSVGGQKIED